MAGPDFSSAARSLALPVDHDSDDDGILPRHNPSRQASEPPWSRRNTSSPVNYRPRTVRDKWIQTAEGWQRQYMKTWRRFTPLQQIGLSVAGIFFLVLTILFLVYNKAIFAWLTPMAEKWRKLPGGWLILWVMTFFVAFPPMIGYSTCVTLAGFVFGMPGWFIVATASVAGSTCAFVASRTVLRTYVTRLTEKNKRFAALSLVLKHDGLKLLTMIRYCPLPYSLSNGAISTIPTVSWPNFAIATAFATPRLALHVFVGSRLGDLARNGDKMDTKTRLVSYVSIAIGIFAGVATGYLVYVRTSARAKQLEEEEEEAGGTINGRRSSTSGSDFLDDPESTTRVERSRDDISLHTAYEDDANSAGGARGATYRDEFTDDEDAMERDVFDVGDGEDDYDDEGSPKARR